jgi:transposase-like protein
MQNSQPKYDESFKKSLVSLHQNGKTLTQLHSEYGVSFSALSKWIKQYSEIKLDDENGTIMTAKQIKQLQKRNAALEEET